MGGWIAAVVLVLAIVGAGALVWFQPYSYKGRHRSLDEPTLRWEREP